MVEWLADEPNTKLAILITATSFLLLLLLDVTWEVWRIWKKWRE